MTNIMNRQNEKEKRRDLRKKQTPEEKIVWKMLCGKKMGLKWRRQVSIGVYIADFYCNSKKLVIELDGNQHLNNREYDSVRDTFFKSLGITTIRIPNSVFKDDLEIIYQKINECIDAQPLSC